MKPILCKSSSVMRPILSVEDVKWILDHTVIAVEGRTGGVIQRLCESHEQLRSELSAANKRPQDNCPHCGDKCDLIPISPTPVAVTR